MLSSESKLALNIIHNSFTLGADKSLYRPGRKQATATKLQLMQATWKKI